MSALVPPDGAPQLSAPGDFESTLIAQLEQQQAVIAQELHDALGSKLAAIAMMLGSIKAMLPASTATYEAIASVLRHTEEAAQITRQLARGLMPVDTTPGAFWRVLERLCADYDQINGVTCKFEMHGNFDSVPPQDANHLYRIAQEAITNALRAGAAKQLGVSLAQHGSLRHMVVSDDGSGFNPAEQAQQSQGGMGLGSMRARTHMLGGDISFKRKPSGGMAVTVVWTERAEASA